MVISITKKISMFMNTIYSRLILFFVLSLFSQSIFAAFVPRVGASVSRNTYVFLEQFENERAEVGGGLEFGMTAVGTEMFLDFSVDATNIETIVSDITIFDSGWRNSMSLAGGYYLGSNFWLTGGFQVTAYGDSVLSGERGKVFGPFIGFNLTNIHQGNYLFAFAFAFKPVTDSSGVVFQNPNGEEAGDSAGSVRVNWRKKGSPHMWSWKHELNSVGSGFQDKVMRFGYTYLFL